MWDVYAASYDRVMPELPFYKEVVERHCAAIEEERVRTVLDLGAGTGAVALPMLKLGKRVTAVDIGRATLARLYAKLDDADADRLTVIEDTAESLPQLRDEAFDAVNVLLAFFDMNDPEAALGEALRLLRKGGKLILTVSVRADLAVINDTWPQWAKGCAAEIHPVSTLMRVDTTQESQTALGRLKALNPRSFSTADGANIRTGSSFRWCRNAWLPAHKAAF